MNITIDLIIPPVIVAMLISIIITTNALIIDSTVENRLSYELQYFANTSINVIQNEVRGLQDVIQANGTQLRFTRFNQDTVHMYQNGRELVVTTDFADGSPDDITRYPAKLGDLDFNLNPSGITLNVQLVTESRPEQEVGNNTERYTAIAEKSIYLRNRHMTQF